MAPKVHTVGPQHGHEHTHTIIFLHGRDSTNDEFASELFESEASPGIFNAIDEQRTLAALLPTVRWVFPTAPLLRSERFDTVMSQWFDMWSVEDPDQRPELQISGLQVSVAALLDVIRDEEELVPRNNIFLAGISQGFAVALAAFFADGRGFAGLLGLCSWMPFAGPVDAIKDHDGEQSVLGEVQVFYSGLCAVERSDTLDLAGLMSTPIFMGHAQDDAVVPVENGRRMRGILTDRIRLSVFWHEYPEGGHWVNEPQGVDDMVRFITKHMSPKDSEHTNESVTTT